MVRIGTIERNEDGDRASASATFENGVVVSFRERNDDHEITAEAFDADGERVVLVEFTHNTEFRVTSPDEHLARVLEGVFGDGELLGESGAVVCDLLETGHSERSYSHQAMGSYE